ncbi:universal stress protein [Flexistipes sinusarabici]|uniref:Universal stress protein n=1 Tax=Flexistipes sinusarabici TaxID=2352 RepID=A0A3D5QC48_FLESI|nr:universal stress protein [Flexistipes sinusarabici]HCW93411.1 universal stress protein [Flexistipes sinusarabici]
MSIYKNILVMTDFSVDSDNAVKTAGVMAKKLGAKLFILHVIHDESKLNTYISSRIYNTIKEMIDKETAELYEKMDDRIPEIAGVDYKKILRRGVPSEECLLEIDKGDYDLVVIGSHGKSGLKKFVMGSTAEKVLKKSPISVHVTKNPTQ